MCHMGYAFLLIFYLFSLQTESELGIEDFYEQRGIRLTVLKYPERKPR